MTERPAAARTVWATPNLYKPPGDLAQPDLPARDRGTATGCAGEERADG
jgi:hypothetical protein